MGDNTSFDSKTTPNGSTDKQTLDEETAVQDTGKADGSVELPNSLASLGNMRKHVLMCCFCLSLFIDSAGVSAAFLSTAPIAHDLGITPANEAWVPTSYSLAFGATLLLAGRLTDMFSPKVVFTIGYGGIGITYLVISFMTNQYAFFVMRAMSALLAVLTIPSSINMIVQMYPEKHQQAKKLAQFGIAGALASALAPILVGCFLLASWRWYFRFIAFVALPFTVLSAVLLPQTAAVAQLHGTQRWKHLDMGGVVILMATLILFILAFTQAGISGWASALFLAPLLVSLFVAFPAFILWERHVAGPNALLPPGLLKFPNLVALMLAAPMTMWFAFYQMRTAVYWQTALGDSPIVAAAKLVPMGVSGVVVGLLINRYPQVIAAPRYFILAAALAEALAALLLAFSGGGWGTGYWKWVFPGLIVGTAGGMVQFVVLNTAIIQAFPRQYAGVAGSFANVVMQVATTVGIALQAGIVATGRGGTDWSGDRNAYVAITGIVLICGGAFALKWKQPEDKNEPAEGVSDCRE